jgi:hypothetical protein
LSDHAQREEAQPFLPLNLANVRPVGPAMNPSRGLPATLPVLPALALVPAAAAATPRFDREIPVPGIETPDKIVEGQDGDVWVAVSGANAGDDDVAGSRIVIADRGSRIVTLATGGVTSEEDEVRAVRDGVADSTPAKRNFRVVHVFATEPH